jgi:hypothetical protein
MAPVPSGPAISAEEVNELGLETGQSVRLRVVTPRRLVLCVVGALAGARVESLADLQREFNHQPKTGTRYQAFYNRLARPGFPEFADAKPRVPFVLKGDRDNRSRRGQPASPTAKTRRRPARPRHRARGTAPRRHRRPSRDAPAARRLVGDHDAPVEVEELGALHAASMQGRKWVRSGFLTPVEVDLRSSPVSPSHPWRGHVTPDRHRTRVVDGLRVAAQAGVLTRELRADASLARAVFEQAAKNGG